MAEYDGKFYAFHLGGSAGAALKTLPHVFSLFCPASVVDIGCGGGAWLKACRELGVKHILGLDGPYVTNGGLQIPLESFRAVDLEHQRITLDRRFDLAMSLEVAEHLSPNRADTFVEDLCNASDTILFSAAMPKQGGTGHINEQWPSYWIQKFMSRGFNCFDCIRPLIWGELTIPFWYKQNILLFSKDRIFPRLVADPKQCDIIHPNCWSNKLSDTRFLFKRLVVSLIPQWVKDRRT